LAPNSSVFPFVDRGLDIVTESPSFVLMDRRKAGTDSILVFRSSLHWQS